MKVIIQILMLTVTLNIVSFALAGKYNAIMEIGDPLPQFHDLSSISGKTISSDDLTEDILVFVSLANHCPWVRGMDKDLVELANSNIGKSVRIIGLSVNNREDDRLPAMKVHAEKNGYTFEYIYDESQHLGRMLGATRTPEYFVFNNARKLVYMGALYNSPAKMGNDGSVKHINGKPTQFYVRDAIDSLINGKDVAIKETRAHGCSVKYVE